MRILVIEDNPKLGALLSRRLTEGGYATDAVPDIAGAEAALAAGQYDLLVLDLGLPDGDGRELLRRLRRRANQGQQSVLILVASARAGLAERIDTLDEGADDYLTKPFAAEELLARVRVLQRRPRQMLDPVLAAGNVTLELANMTVRIGETVVEMPPREVRVLGVLLRHAGRLVARQELERQVYALSDEVSPNALEVAVSRLRRRLETHEANVRLIAMRGFGYILSHTE